MVQKEARDFDAFYQAPIPPPAVETAPILVVSLDGKGMLTVKATPAPRVARHDKGKKIHKQKMALAATVDTQQPRLRSPKAVIASRFASPPGPADHPVFAQLRPEHKRV